MELPPIDLEKLEPKTRDWLLAKAAAEAKSPLEIIREELDTSAGAAGFGPKKVA